ncbi:MAG TPA: MFS transporter [Xanthobacteraceae bacterium]|nr:MFS transporter [Xanthobacteraceae bacterium]
MSSMTSYASALFRSRQGTRRAQDLAHAHKGAVLFTMCLGVFVAQLDSSVVNLAVKHIGGDLDAGVNQLQWVLDSYNLVYATLLLTGGTLGDLYGRTRIFVLGIGLIAAGSLICALAPNAAILIAGRAVTGLGAALELPTTLAILTVTYADPKERGRAIGIWASLNGVALAVGPTIGGLLVDLVGWRSIFLLVVPVTLLALVMALKAVPESRHPEGRQLDPAGQALAIVALAALSFVAIEGPHMGWTSPAILTLMGTCAVAALLFWRVESGRTGALVPLDIFANRSFSTAITIAGLMTFGMYAMLFLVPLYLQSIGQMSAFAAGLALLPMSITFVIVSQFSGALAKRLGARVMTTSGMGLMGTGLLLLALVSREPNLLLIEAALLIIGAGLGLNTGPVNAVAVASVAPSRSGMASGLINTTRMVGATLGIAVLGSLFAVHAGEGAPESMITGLRLAFLGGAAAELTGAALAFAFIRAGDMEQRSGA